MKVIYYCYGGTHTSVLAAALHLGMIRKDKLPSAEEIFSCPNFDRVENRDIGKIFFMGIDEKGQEIYVMGCKNCGMLVERAIFEFSRIMGSKGEDVVMVNTLSCLNIFMRLGGFLSRRLRLAAPGRLFLLLGVRVAFPEINKKVEELKEKIK